MTNVQMCLENIQYPWKPLLMMQCRDAGYITPNIYHITRLLYRWSKKHRKYIVFSLVIYLFAQIPSWNSLSWPLDLKQVRAIKCFPKNATIFRLKYFFKLIYVIIFYWMTNLKLRVVKVITTVRIFCNLIQQWMHISYLSVKLDVDNRPSTDKLHHLVEKKKKKKKL